MKKKEYLWYILIAVAITFLALNIGWRTAQVTIDFEKEYSVGDSIKGVIIINEEYIKSEDTLALISLSKDDKVIHSRVFSIKDLRLHKKNKSGRYYNINIEEILNYTFNESGRYEVLFSITETGLNEVRVFEVK